MAEKEHSISARLHNNHQPIPTCVFYFVLMKKTTICIKCVMPNTSVNVFKSRFIFEYLKVNLRFKLSFYSENNEINVLPIPF